MPAEMMDKDAIEAIKQANLAKTKMSSIGMETEEIKPHTKDISIELNGLPSGGSFYKNPVRISPLKVRDILLLGGFDENNIQDKFNQIFLSRVSGVTPREILICDEMYLAFWLRDAAFPQVGFPSQGHVCKNPDCGHVNSPGSVTFNVDDITFSVPGLKDIIQKFREGNGKISITLPISKKEYRISPRRRGHVDRYRKIIKRDFTDMNLPLDEETAVLLRIATVLNNDEGQDLMEIVEELSALPPIDFVKLCKEVERLSMKADPIISMPCAKCKEVTPVTGYSFLPETFFPTDQL